MDEPTQPSTLPGYEGRANAFSLPEYDEVICILHPSSPPAFEVAKYVWQSTPEHILQYQRPGLTADGGDEGDMFKMEGLEGEGESPPEPEMPENLDIALRTSSKVKSLSLGFVFGRESRKADIVIRTTPNGNPRISAMHFRIYVNEYGVLMLEDTSTNGTYVEGVLLNKRNPGRMLNHGDALEVITEGYRQTGTVDKARFIVILPQRKDGTRYNANLREYLSKVQQANQTARPEVPTFVRPFGPAGRDLLTAGTVRYSWAMGWNGNGKYNPIGEIGKGAFATVLKVATADHGEIFAAKRIDRSAFIKNGILDGKFYNELNIMKKVDHPHVVAFHDWHLDSHHLYIVMEYVPCGDMAPYTLKENSLGEPVVKSITKQLLHALEYIHYNGIVHRDIKPENLLVYCKEPFFVKLTDFGLSKMIDTNDKAAMITFCGTLLYCAPEVYPDFEQMRTGAPRTRRHRTSTPKPYSSAVDIWSLGSVLYYFMAFKPPYKGSAEDQGYKMLHSILYDHLDVAALQPPRIQPSGLLFLQNMLNVVGHLRPSAKELLGFEWMKDVTDVVPVPRLEGTESFADMRLETLKEEDENAERELPGGSNGFDESESFAKAAQGLLDTTEGPPVISDLNPIQGRLMEADDNFDIPKTERANSMQDENSAQSGDGESAIFQARQAAPQNIGQPDIELDRTLHPQNTHPANMPAFRQKTPGEGRFNIGSSGEISSETSSHSLLSNNSNPSILEGWSQAQIVSSDPPAGYPLPADAGITSRPATTPLFGEITEEGALAGESGVFGASHRPLIYRDSEAMSGSKWSSSSTGVSVAGRKLDGLNVQASDHPSKHTTTSHTTMSLVQKGKRHRLAEVTNAEDVDETSSEGEPAAKKSMTHANKSASNSGPSTASEDDLSHSVSQGINSLRLQGFQLGTLTPVSGSFSNVPLVLNSRMTIWGRSPNSTHVYPNPTDTRVPKNGMDIYFWSASSGQNIDWRNLDGIHAMIMTRSRNGIKVNNVRLTKSPSEGPFKVGKLKTGDIIETFNDGKSFLKYRCDFSFGESATERVADEEFVVEDNTELYAAAVAGQSQSLLAAQNT